MIALTFTCYTSNTTRIQLTLNNLRRLIYQEIINCYMKSNILMKKQIVFKQISSSSSSSSSCRAASTDIPDPLSSLFPIVHRLWQVFRATSSHCCCMYVRAGRPAFARLYVGVYRSTSVMSSFLVG